MRSKDGYSLAQRTGSGSPLDSSVEDAPPQQSARPPQTAEEHLVAHPEQFAVDMWKVRQHLFEAPEFTRTNLGMLRYLLFLVVVFRTMSAMRWPSTSLKHQQTLEDLLLDEEFADVHNMKKTWYDVGTVEEMWQWARGPLGGALLADDGNPGSLTAMLGTNQLIGPVRMRQARVKGAEERFVQSRLPGDYADCGAAVCCALPGGPDDCGFDFGFDDGAGKWCSRTGQPPEDKCTDETLQCIEDPSTATCTSHWVRYCVKNPDDLKCSTCADNMHRKLAKGTFATDCTTDWPVEEPWERYPLPRRREPADAEPDDKIVHGQSLTPLKGSRFFVDEHWGGKPATYDSDDDLCEVVLWRKVWATLTFQDYECGDGSEWVGAKECSKGEPCDNDAFERLYGNSSTYLSKFTVDLDLVNFARQATPADCTVADGATGSCALNSDGSACEAENSGCVYVPAVSGADLLAEEFSEIEAGKRPFKVDIHTRALAFQFSLYNGMHTTAGGITDNANVLTWVEILFFLAPSGHITLYSRITPMPVPNSCFFADGYEWKWMDKPTGLKMRCIPDSFATMMLAPAMSWDFFWLAMGPLSVAWLVHEEFEEVRFSHGSVISHFLKGWNAIELIFLALFVKYLSCVLEYRDEMVRVVDDIIEHPDGFTDLSDARSAFRDRMQFFGIFMFFVIMKVSYEAHNHTTLTVKEKKLVDQSFTHAAKHKHSNGRTTCRTIL
jgi:hypothetical protein